jgi:hypothetical protein
MTALKFILGLLATVPSCHALTPPPLWPNSTTVRPNAKIDPARSLFLGDRKVVLEETKLKEILSVAPAKIQEQVDAGESLAWVCYTLENDRERLWLSSDEMGGMEYINSAVLTEIPATDTSSEDCPQLPGALTPVRFKPDVRIGRTLVDVEKKFGKSTRTGNAAYFEFEKNQVTTQGEWDTSGTMVLRVLHGKITAIHISHSTSN